MATDYTDTILSIKADVYETSPVGSQTTWLPKATSALVSICLDSTGNLCKIISVLGQTTIINSSITPTSHFVESSALFGTWYDELNDTTFGVGFANGSDLKAFANAFVQAKKRLEELASPTTVTSGRETSLENSCSVDQDQEESASASTTNTFINSKNSSTCHSHSFLTFDYHDTLTGTSCIRKMDDKNEDRLLNNNSDSLCSASCDGLAMLSAIPIPHFTLSNSNNKEFVVMNISGPNPNEIKTVAQENAYLRKSLADASKNFNDWHLELDSHRKLSEALSKAKEEALRVMEEWKSKSYEYQREANIWKERCEKSENMAQNLAEETISKYKEQLKDAINGKEYYKNILQEKEVELRDLQEQLENQQDSRPSPNQSQSTLAIKRENESLKASVARAKQQESISTHLANEQWTVMRDSESRLAEGIQKLIDIHTELKRSVKQGANLREQTP